MFVSFIGVMDVVDFKNGVLSMFVSFIGHMNVHLVLA
jgi:hypothetical protein